MRLHEEDLKEMAELEAMKKSGLKGYWPGYFFDRKKALEIKNATDFEQIMDNADVMPVVFTSYMKSEKARTTGLKKFKGPVSIIQGRQDPIGESTVQEIHELLPQSQIHFIEKCGHLPWWENDDQVKLFFDILQKSLQ
jgi:proline iminopeptidase